MVGVVLGLMSASWKDVEVLQFDQELGVVLPLNTENLALDSGVIVDQSFLAPWMEVELLVAPGMDVELLHMVDLHC